VLVAAIAILALVSSVRTKDAVAVRHAEQLVAVHELRTLVEQKVATARAHLLAGEPRYHAELEADRARILAHSVKLRGAQGPEGDRLLDRLAAADALHHTAIEQLLATTPAHTAELAARWEVEVGPLRAEMRRHVDDLLAGTRALHEAAEAEARELNRRATLLIGAAALVGLLAASWMGRNLTRRLAAVYRAERDALHRQREASEELQIIVDSLPVMVAHLDTDGRYRFVNRAYEEWFGKGRAEIVGAPRLDILGAGTYAELDSKVKRALCGERVVHEMRVPHRDGSLREVVATYVPLCGPDRDVAGYVTLVRDVTAEHRARERERFLAQATALLSASLEFEAALTQLVERAVPEIADGCSVDVLGPGDGEPAHHVEAGAAAATVDPVARVLESAAAQRSETLIAAPMVARGTLVGALALCLEGPRRRYDDADFAFVEELARRAALAVDHARLYRAANRALVEREEVVAIVSHDLRNPLGVILLKTDALAKEVKGMPAAERHVESIERAADRMESLIQTLLDAARIERGRLELVRRPLEPGALLREVGDLLEGLATEKSLRLVVEVADALPLVHADRDRVLQVLENLAGNAIKFTPPGGHVELRVEPGPAEARFEVCDNGPGIAPADLARLWDRYYQGERKRRKGLGLGLYIARGIVEAHGGRIWVESQEGKGTTFTFTVPAADPAALGLTDEAAASPDFR
jgi:PAS domain S-box-containing protein